PEVETTNRLSIARRSFGSVERAARSAFDGNRRDPPRLERHAKDRNDAPKGLRKPNKECFWSDMGCLLGAAVPYKTLRVRSARDPPFPRVDQCRRYTLGLRARVDARRSLDPSRSSAQKCESGLD